jgi:16S rRNA (guanine527-N7)-methyltransferase
MAPGDAALRAALQPYGVSVTDAQAEGVRRYLSTLLQWNQKISLTSLTSPKEILQRHFGESMFAAHVVPVRHGRLADVGSGAGFPGLALKLLSPELDVLLIEPNTKKAAFLAEVKRQLGLPGVEILRTRFEALAVPQPLADFISARALGNRERLLRWAWEALPVCGRILLWLGARDAEQVSLTRGWSWRRQIPIPISRRRVLLVGKREQG